MSDPAFDGLCGIPFHIALRGGQYLRCQHVLGHHGPHSWHKYEDQFIIFGGIYSWEIQWADSGPVLNHPKQTTVLSEAEFDQLKAEYPSLSFTTVKTVALPSNLDGDELAVRIEGLKTNWYLRKKSV